MKRVQLLSRQLNWMQLLEGVLCNIVKSRAMKQRNSCHTLSLVLYLKKVELHLGSNMQRLRNIRHVYLSAEENMLSMWKRQVNGLRFTTVSDFWYMCSFEADIFAIDDRCPSPDHLWTTMTFLFLILSQRYFNLMVLTRLFKRGQKHLKLSSILRILTMMGNVM